MSTETKVIDITTQEHSEKTELIKRRQIENTPFMIVTTAEGSFGAMAEYRLTEPMQTEKEVEEYFKDITWDKIATLILILIEKQSKQ